MKIDALSTATYCRVRSLIDAMPPARATLLYLSLGGETSPERLALASGLGPERALTELARGERDLRRELLGSTESETELEARSRFPDSDTERAIVELYRRAQEIGASDGGGESSSVSELEIGLLLVVAAACVFTSLQPLLYLVLSFD